MDGLSTFVPLDLGRFGQHLKKELIPLEKMSQRYKLFLEKVRGVRVGGQVVDRDGASVDRRATGSALALKASVQKPTLLHLTLPGSAGRVDEREHRARVVDLEPDAPGGGDMLFDN